MITGQIPVRMQIIVLLKKDGVVYMCNQYTPCLRNDFDTSTHKHNYNFLRGVLIAKYISMHPTKNRLMCI